MPTPSDIRVTFSLDLKPFADGLKSMLAMTQAAGRQIQPVLNLQAKPDFSVFDAQLKALSRSVDEYITAQAEAAKAATGMSAATEQMGQKTEEFGEKVSRSSSAIKEKSTSLNKMKRDALEVFGALSFMATGLVDIASSAAGGSKELQKLSSGMRDGVAAGFGLASMLSLLGITTGGTAVAIGSFIAIGTALLRFFDDSEQKAERAQKAMSQFTASLRGASAQDLLRYRDSLITASAESKKRIEELERLRIEALKSGQLSLAGALQDAINREAEFGQKHAEFARQVEQQITGMMMTEAEVREKIRELEMKSVADKFDRMEREADEDLRKNLERIEHSSATEETKRKAREAAERAHAARIKEIRDLEQQEHEERVGKALERFREQQKQEQQLELETAQASLDAQKARMLASAKSAQERVAIETMYAEHALKTEEAVRLASAETEEEKVMIQRKFAALRAKLREESTLKFLEAERQDVEAAKSAEEEKKRLWRETHRVGMTLIDGMTDGFQQMFGQLLIHQRQAKNDWDAAWLAMQNATLQALARIATDWLKTQLELVAMTETAEKTKTAITESETASRVAARSTETSAELTMAAAAGVSGTATAAKGAAVLPFPANLIAIAAVIAAVSAMFRGIFKAFGFEKGGRIEKGQRGFFEGFSSEIIAPEKDFYDIARLELIPRLIEEQNLFLARELRDRIATSHNTTVGFEEVVWRFERAVERLANIEWKASGRELKAVLKHQREFDRTVGI